MLHFETIEPATLGLLRKLQDLPILRDCRLVGGTSLALQIGHRKSVDLDLFGKVDALPEEIEEALHQFGNLQVRKNSGNIHLFVLNGIHVDIVNFLYPWQHDAVMEDGLRLAHVEDIAAMKVTAVIGRGTKKDFIDIATLLDSYSLNQILSFYKDKYPNPSTFMAIKSLSYFDDAEEQPMPYMFSSLTWDEAKSKVLKAIEKV
ncbi:MAG: nucleotidyl transferase AbiEii/AbiGii toxin family protein [Bacteroidales bacterium]|nr:nucleotidyl transferase AbiEii/AbiGii toxin family protein [Bacteroidales bacterium]